MKKSAGRLKRLMTAAAVAITGLGLAGAAAGTAQAALPDAWGFALVESPSGPAVAGHWAESVPSPPPVASPGSPGQEIIKFPGIGIKGGVVHVTAVIDVMAWCQAQKWGPSGSTETVVVQCYGKGGVPGFVPFTVTFSASSGPIPGAGLLYAYVHDTNASVAASYNSAGGANTVTSLGTGQWLVRLPGPGPAAQTGGVQVTAANPAKPAICDVASWVSTPTGQNVRVRCYNPVGAPQPSGWSLTYQNDRAITGAAPKLHAYTLNNQPLVAGPYVPAPAGINFSSAGGVNTVTRAGLAQSLVRFPLVAFKPDTVLVTALDPGPKVCNLNTLWATGGSLVTVRDVVCYLPTGAMDPTQSLVSYDTNS
jgi:hypothetical protein